MTASEPKKQPYLSVVIPTFNLADSIEVTLRMLDAQALDASAYEILFVDDGSTDGTAEQIESWRTDAAYRVLRNERNLGRARTRNRGWQEARGDVIVFLDGDMLPGPGLLARYHEHFKNGDADVVSGRRYHLDLRQVEAAYGSYLASLAAQPSLDPLFQNNAALDFASILEHADLGVEPGPVQAQLEQELGGICERFPHSRTRALAFITGNVAVRHELLSETGGFYPFLTRAEDTDLGLRLAEHGARFTYDKKAVAIHPYHDVAADQHLYRENLQTLIVRHPFGVVVLWFLWARYLAGASSPPVELPWLMSLTAIAGAEFDGTLAGTNVVALAERDGAYNLPGRFNTSGEELCDYYRAVHRLPLTDIQHFLTQAVAAGVLSRRSTDGIYFDAPLFRIWLDEHTLFREQAYRHSFFRQQWQNEPQFGGRSKRWQGEYELRLPRELPRQQVAVNLALPYSAPCQNETAIIDWDPPELNDYVRGGMVLGFPIDAAKRNAGRIGYRFTCVVTEWNTPLPDPPDPGPQVIDRWLGPGYGPSDMLDLYQHLQTIVPAAAATAQQKARAIYEWMLNNCVFKPSTLPDLSVLSNGFGHCIQLSRIFVNLCRLAGIPARERCGALASWCETEPDDNVVWSRDYFTPFAHTWAEFYSVEDEGWLPAEFLTLGHGARGATPHNFVDNALRAQFLAEGALFDQFYFGNLDPFRIYSDPHANLLPTFSQHDGVRWQPLSFGLRARHTLKLTYIAGATA